MAVLISGEGSNLQAILDTVHGQGDVEVACVAASTPHAGGIERARRASVETAVFAAADHDERQARDAALGDWLEERRVGLVVLAGWMELLGPAFIGRFRGRIINVHPSLLPAFPGIRAIQQALEYGVKVLGVTVHFVDEGVDSGAIILQEAFPCPYPRHIAAIEEHVHRIEHRLLPRAVRLFAEGRLRIDPDRPRQVVIEDGHRD